MKRAKMLRYGNDELREPYHYTECGLDDVYLVSGYERHETPYGEGVSVRDADELHRVIGEHLAKHKKVLTGKEIRFLRKQMELSQSDLGRWLGVSDQQVARYEKEECVLPGPADGLLRALYLETVGEPVKLRELLTELEEVDAPVEEMHVFGMDKNGWKSQLAA